MTITRLKLWLNTNCLFHDDCRICLNATYSIYFRRIITKVADCLKKASIFLRTAITKISLLFKRNMFYLLQESYLYIYIYIIHNRIRSTLVLLEQILFAHFSHLCMGHFVSHRVRSKYLCVYKYANIWVYRT